MPDKQHAGAFVVPVKDKYQIYAVCGTSFSVHKGFRVKSCSGGPLHIQTITKLSDWKLFLIKNRIIYLFHLWIEITAKSRIELENTRMSRSRNGERTSAVKVLETTVGGFFSGSLNKCWRQEDVLKLRLLDCKCTFCNTNVDKTRCFKTRPLILPGCLVWVYKASLAE